LYLLRQLPQLLNVLRRQVIESPAAALASNERAQILYEPVCLFGAGLQLDGCIEKGVYLGAEALASGGQKQVVVDVRTK
jgi:hypothetical protein